MVNPTIILNETQNPSAWNYAYIPDFNRYYYVQEWTYNRGLWESSLRCDVLATWKTNIGSSSQYIVRSSAQSNGEIQDNKYPTYNITTDNFTIPALFDNYSMSGGGYVVGIANGDSSGVGAVGYYYFTNSQMRNFLNNLMSSADWTNIEEEAQNTLKAAFNPIQYIVSAMWVPSTPDLGNVLSSIDLGWWSIDGACSRVSNPVYMKTVTVSIPKHPQAAARGNYLNGSPYTRYEFNIPPFGTIPVDATILRNVDSVILDLVLDTITGAGILTFNAVHGSETAVAKVVRAQVGVPIQMAQVLRDDFSALGVALSSGNTLSLNTLGGMLSGGPYGAVAGAIGGVISAIGDVIDSAMPQLQTTGSNGSFAEYQTFNQLVCYFFNVVDDDNSNLGRPLCAIRTISTIPGYIMTYGADVQTNGTESENAEIESYMNGGFFYE